MKTIWKFPLVLKTFQKIAMPSQAQVLTVQMQSDALCLWAIVNPEAPIEQRDFIIAGTGDPQPFDEADLRYIGSVQQRAFVWHVFELPDKEQTS